MVRGCRVLLHTRIDVRETAVCGLFLAEWTGGNSLFCKDAEKGCAVPFAD